MHPDATAVSAQGVREVAHCLQLRAVQKGREAGQSREASQRSGSAGVSGVLAGDGRRYPGGRTGRSERRGAGRAVGDDNKRCPAHVAESEYVEILGRLSALTFLSPLTAAGAAVGKLVFASATVLTLIIEGPTRHCPDERHHRAEGEAKGKGEDQGETPDRSGEAAVEAACL